MNESSELQSEDVERFVTSVLYRYTCPTAESLLSYAWGLLNDMDTQDVTVHLRKCPHCRAEIAELQPPEEVKAISPDRSIRTYWARLVPSFAATRSSTHGVHSSARLFEVESIGWEITLNWIAALGAVYTVQGQLFGPLPEEMPTISVALVSARSEILTSQPDETGIFVLNNVPERQYQVHLNTSIGQIVITDFP